jgi:hypothetical protein
MIADAILKHLPPSTSRLTLLDVNGEARAHLPETGFVCIPVSGNASAWDIPENSVDAVVALDYVLNDTFLTQTLNALRAGGRMIVINRRGVMNESIGRRLERIGFVRILVEGESTDEGVLIRGEKRHQQADTLARIATVANHEADIFTLETYKGRFLHLLVIQTPNKPVWKLTRDEIIRWQAVTVTHEGQRALLAFSSLPKAVNFMQPAVLNGHITGINKVGKFRKEHAPTWDLPILINPVQAVFEAGTVSLFDVDPTLAEAPNE